MIVRVRAVYDPEHAGFDGEGKPVGEPDSLKGLIKEGYIELLGVINPRAVGEIHYASPPPKPNPDKEALKTETEQDVGPTLYEYFWSVGITGFDPKWYERLDDDDPIVVQLIYHTKDSKYSIQEVAANLKQVPPFPKTTERKIRDWFEQFLPVVGTAGKVMELAGATVSGKIISAISQMKLNTVPVDEFPWWVKTFSTGENAGVEWHIPKRLVQYIGNRLVGSLGLYFIECDTPHPTPKGEISIELRTFLRSQRRWDRWEELYISPTDKKTELVLKPNEPEPKQ